MEQSRFKELEQVKETMSKLREVYLNIYKDKLVKYAGYYILVNDAEVTLSDDLEYYITLSGKGVHGPTTGVLMSGPMRYISEARAPITNTISLDATSPTEKLPIIENDTIRLAIITMADLERRFKDGEIE